MPHNFCIMYADTVRSDIVSLLENSQLSTFAGVISTIGM